MADTPGPQPDGSANSSRFSDIALALQLVKDHVVTVVSRFSGIVLMQWSHFQYVQKNCRKLSDRTPHLSSCRYLQLIEAHNVRILIGVEIKI